jgi:serine/threonine-protein kinase
LKTVRLADDVAAERRPEMHTSLVQEALTVARLNHPNIVSVYDFEESGDAAFVAMELVDGLSLERLLLKHGRLKAEQTVPLGAAVARGLAAAHGQGIVHRDVKPANVLLGRDGSIKVADFGIADLVSRNRVVGVSVFGTPGYLAPEVLLGTPYGAAADLFALGVLLYECLTGGPPFDGWESAAVVRSTLFETIRPPRSRVKGVPAQLDSLVLHLLEKDPALRPADAAAVAAELERMAAHLGVRWDFARAGAEEPLGSPPAPRPAQWIGTVRLKPEKGTKGT